jgi:tRNA threonylcarbamoyladenosine modification (KEOPS) complex Cgi121 subunit
MGIEVYFSNGARQTIETRASRITVRAPSAANEIAYSDYASFPAFRDLAAGKTFDTSFGRPIARRGASVRQVRDCFGFFAHGRIGIPKLSRRA